MKGMKRATRLIQMPTQCREHNRSLYSLKVLEVLMLKSLSGCDSFVWLVPQHFLSVSRNK
jgi:hypothetical protein